MLSLEKDAQLRLTRDQVEADEIKKHGQIEAKRIFEEGRKRFLEDVEHDRQALHNQLKLYEERILSEALEKETSIKNYYQEHKSSIAKEFVEHILKLLEDLA